MIRQELREVSDLKHTNDHRSISFQLHRYTPDGSGNFAGQNGYGYQSIARFISAAEDVNQGQRSLSDIKAEGLLALADSTLAVTAVLEAGRLSLDAGGAGVAIEYNNQGQPCGLAVEK